MFQYTHPYGCDDTRITIEVVDKRFNTRTRMGATRPTSILLLINLCFNTRTRMGATKSDSKLDTSSMFQYTHPYGCDSAMLKQHGLCKFDNYFRVAMKSLHSTITMSKIKFVKSLHYTMLHQTRTTLSHVLTQPCCNQLLVNNSITF